MKAEVAKAFPDVKITCKKITSAMNKLFPSVKYKDCRRNNVRLTCFNHLKRKELVIVDLSHSYMDTFRSAGFSVLSQTCDRIVVSIPTKFTADNFRLHKELSIPLDITNTKEIR